MSTDTVIKSPKGAAAEYAKHSFSAYKRCTNQCQYCYLNRGVLSKALGTGTPELRSCFKNEDDVVRKFAKEIESQKEQLIADGGIFFSFITDPCLPETIAITIHCASIATHNGVPVTILTKMAGWINDTMFGLSALKNINEDGLLCFGFTLTGHDEMEPYASPNAERISAMKILHDQGIKTFASIEPIIDFDSSIDMIKKSIDFCDLFRIGLRSGVKSDYYDRSKLAYFIGQVEGLVRFKEFHPKVYWKQSIRKSIHFPDPDYWTSLRCYVDSDYNIFSGVKGR